MIVDITFLSLGLFAIGYLLSAQLYRRQGKRLRGSELETKILFWIPLYGVAVVFAISNTWVRLALTAAVAIQLGRDVLGQKIPPRHEGLVVMHSAIVALSLCSAIGVATYDEGLFLALWLMSVLSDVGAFFVGNYFGKHRLPKWLNSHKSWEGVGGQLLGALLGFVLLNSLIAPLPLYFVITIGLGSALGDLINSYIKRRLGISAWSKRLPGHGGYLDRFSSLALALLCSYIALLFYDSWL